MPGQRTLSSSKAFDPHESHGLTKTLSYTAETIAQPWSETQRRTMRKALSRTTTH